jgi:transposase
MRQPDCLLKEYIEEIGNRYGVTVTVSRLSVILKELGITHRKVCLRLVLG